VELTGWTLWLAAAASAQSLEIRVPDPMVTALVLTCADGTLQVPVKDGAVKLERTPQSCAVSMVRRSGEVTEPGRWTCTLDRCTQEEVAHRPVSDAPGRVNVILTTEVPPGSALELTCSEGFRARADVSLNTAVFDGVPDEECTLFFKGGVPAKFRPIRQGTWSCGLSNTVAVCTRR
jgi:hypothetical protein